MDEMTGFAALLPGKLLAETGPLPADLTELRVRAGRRIQLVRLSGEEFRGKAADAALAEETAQALAGHSLYAREEELKEGYFTVRGGCRVGVCGRFSAGGQARTLTHVGSVCVRIAREARGAADGVMREMFDRGRPVSALVVSPPGLGKTTLLRDIARQLSEGTGGRRGVKVGVADERGELAGCVLGRPSLDVGPRTDVMDGCPKRIGMELLVRGMSPDVIVTDELGHDGDREAVLDAMRSGVRVIASVHARDEEEALRRLGAELAGLFDRMIVLGDRIGQIKRVTGGIEDGYGGQSGRGVRHDGGERMGRTDAGGNAGKAGADPFGCAGRSPAADE